ncbi:prealbumin-like fold domain-containing protein [Ottowia testudinis]|uniref:SpaA-like prealbumin fold domain-containing protein n=1 Tax=Ottowia testudinis TaxID=2816950 RepID=A0A975CH99_9BURK|nr:hypothetical protein [Ottowia testudinis]QTD45786.1 hypothetical protein J1M35_02370 [Ottowia testudinis]
MQFKVFTGIFRLVVGTLAGALVAAAAHAQVNDPTCNLALVKVAGVGSEFDLTPYSNKVTLSADKSIRVQPNTGSPQLEYDMDSGVTRKSDASTNRWIFNESVAPLPYPGNVKTLTIDFNPPVQANQFALGIEDVGYGSTPLKYPATIALSLSGGASVGNFRGARMINGVTPSNALTYSSTSGVLSVPDSTVTGKRYNYALLGQGSELVKTVTLTFADFVPVDSMTLRLFAQTSCITMEKSTVGGTGEFKFTTSNADTPDSTVTTTSQNTDTRSETTAKLTQIATDIVIQEQMPTAPPAWMATSASCVDKNDNITGRSAVPGTLSGSKLTIAAKDNVPNANLVCKFVNMLPTDMSATLTGLPPLALAGTTVTGTLTCKNEGAVDAVAPTCSATVGGAAVSCPAPPATLAAGGTISCPISYTQPAGPVDVVGTAGAANDNNPLNNQAKVTVPSAADMQATLSGFPANAAPGSTVTGTLTCTNVGTQPATAPTCAASGLPPDAVVTCTPNPAPDPLAAGAAITCQVSYKQPAGTGVSVTGTTGATNDGNAANNTASQPVPTPADMSAALSGFPVGAPTGQPVTGTLTCTNVGGQPATAPKCEVSGLPSNAVVTCVPSPAPDPLAVGASITCSVRYTQPEAGVTVTGTTGATNDGNTANNQAQLGVGVPAPVPTLGQYLQALLAVLLALTAVHALRTRQRRGAR